LFDILAKMARNAVHPKDHRNDEDGGDKKEQPLEAVFADTPMLEGNCDSEAECGGQTDAIPDKTGEMRTCGAGKIDENDADDEGSLDAFTKSD